MKNIMEISDALRRQAGQIGLSSKALAEQTGTSTQTLWKVMKGSHDFKVSTLLALADRCNAGSQIDHAVVDEHLHGGLLIYRGEDSEVRHHKDAVHGQLGKT